MARVQCLISHRWIVFQLITVLLHVANAQSPSPPSQHELQQQSPAPSKTTVFAVLVTSFFFFGLLSVYIRHCTRGMPGYSDTNSRRRGGAFDGCSRRGGGLEDAVVESFPVFAYSSVKESKIGSGDLECAICLNELEDRETVRLLPVCNHLFHVDCIDAWLYSHATCPVCRFDLAAKPVKTGAEDRAPVSDHVVIDIREAVEEEKSRHQIVGKFPRSNSTGHSIGRLGGDGAERFTLRLPEDVRRRIMAAKGRRLKRTRSFDADLMDSGYVVGSGGKSERVSWADRWGLFVSKSNSGSVRSPNGGSLT
ncbi:RING-H2 finger protein ATL32-like [Raphanus sativus]|uniref:RING-type E3 ubiquitin transferase n=1 Tax=Raphanus sativus TaxID=3726 RepID=A0A6J0KP50_RAPSA|nr:RING-H2 finger protein ATL32-like [Raphanus sativus]